MTRKPFLLASLFLFGLVSLIEWQLPANQGVTEESSAQADRPAALQSQPVVGESRFTNLIDTTVRWQVHADSLRNLDAEMLATLIRDPSISHRSIPGTSPHIIVDMQAEGIAAKLIEPAIGSLNPLFSAVLSGQHTIGPLTGVSAIDAIAMLRLEENRDGIRALDASSEDIDPSLRLNTTAALGLIGEQADFQVLRELADDRSKYPFTAATALSKITKRLNQ